MKKKTALIIFILLLLPLVLTGCTIPIINREVKLPSLPSISLPSISFPSWVPFLGRKPVPKIITLRYWGLWEREENLMDLFREYEAANPNITIEYEMRDPKDHFETTRARIRTDLTPDIIRVHNTWVPFLLPYLSSIPKDVMDTTTFERTFYPVTKKTLFFNSNYYGLPLEIDGLVLLYNQNLFDQAGLTSPPQTWDQLREYAKKLTKRDEEGNIIQSGAALGYANKIDHFSDILGLMMAQNGVQFEDESGQVTFHQSFALDGSNLASEVLSWYTLFAVSEPTWNSSWEENSTTAFANEKVVMILVPSFRILDILNLNRKINLKVAPAPQLPTPELEGTATETTNINWATFWVEVVPKNSPHSDEAWKLLKFLTEKETLIKFYRNTSYIRAFGEPYPRRDLAADLADDHYLANLVNQGPNYTTWYFADATYDRLLNDEVIKILKVMVETVISGASPETALNEAASSISQILSALRT